MKKGIAIIFLLLFLTPFYVLADSTYSINQFENISQNYLNNLDCDGGKTQKKLYLDKYYFRYFYFENYGDDDAYLQRYNIETKDNSNFLKFNNTEYDNNISMLDFSRDKLGDINWKVNSGEEVRHLTTAEEIENASFQYDWSISFPITAQDDIDDNPVEFYRPNIRVHSHPSKPTFFSEDDIPDVLEDYNISDYDTQIRAATLYSVGEDLFDDPDIEENYIDMQCANFVIRWCGDGMIHDGGEDTDLNEDMGEECDPNHPDWDEDTCNLDCQIIKYDLGVNIEGGGTVEIEIDDSNEGIISESTNFNDIKALSDISLSAEPNSGYEFDGWEGDECGGGSDCDFSLSEDTSITAVFEEDGNGNGGAPEEYELEVESGQGGEVNVEFGGDSYTVSSGESDSWDIEEGTDISLQAEPNSGYEFDGWDGETCGGGTNCSFQLYSDTTEIAEFEEDGNGGTPEEYELEVESGQGGEVNVEFGGNSYPVLSGESDSWNIEEGIDISLQADPNSGYEFDGWEGDECSGGPDCDFSLSEDTTITASFEEQVIEYELEVESGQGGEVNVEFLGNSYVVSSGDSGSWNIEEGTDISLEANSDSGYEFDGWEGGECENEGSTCRFDLNSNTTERAEFEDVLSAEIDVDLESINSLQYGEYFAVWWEFEDDIFTNSCYSGVQSKYDKNQATCHFSIENRDGEVFSTSINCNEIDSDFGRNLFHDFRDDPDGAFVLKADSSNDFDDDFLGEHTIYLDEITNLRYCDGSSFVNTSDESINEYTKFSFLTPYLIQDGIVSSTIDNTVENIYYEDNGWESVDSPGIKQVDRSSSVIDEVFRDLWDYYNVRAVQNVSIGGDSYKKLPGKQVYISDSDVQISDDLASEPYTLIASGVDLTIEGNISGNGMFVFPDGEIEFDLQNCSGQQDVEGIFIANKFVSDEIKNDHLDETWCDDGRLKIDGVLVSSEGIEELVQNRRSYIQDVNNISQDAYEGAAVYIRIRSSIFDQLPPGARGVLDRLQIDRN
ncbi:InlB B-repeat-containing protein [Candidatus Absconditicoccus praedator]|uniref:InlB B-repeat-containing protein n=1 Tax=Candidatus Absconditicoccus praedator TaxID=2735562 RepID=UPI001E53B14D|nr:hypothetical protein [Candidatus Absconditicoccus praedator]UFX82800.1 hypothetical protein HLG78_01465 [Candidatus Absconditicoccus praedator]